jgi:aspartate aminotransferase
VPQAKIIGKKISIIHSSYKDKWQLSPSLFKKFLEKREDKNAPALLILNYPGNPDGVSFKESDLKEVAELARAHNILTLSDEIYGQLHHEGRHVSIGKFYPEGTIISSGLSKWCGAGGWRLGTFTFPKQLKWLMEKMSIVASETYTTVSAPIQHAAIQAFRGGMEIEEYLQHVRRILSTLGKACAKILNQAGVKTHMPMGGFYLFIDFTAQKEVMKTRGIENSATLCRRLLDETGVAILHGSSFSREEQELTARLAYVDFDGARALAASRTIPLHDALPADFCKVYCSSVIAGVTAIAEWVKK